MATSIIAVLINPAGTLVQRNVTMGPGSEALLKSSLQIVGLFIKRDQDESGNPGPWWDEFSGNSAYACQENSDGTGILSHNTPPGTTWIWQWNINHTRGARRQVSNNLAEALMGQGACWDVLDDGSGSYYEQKLAEAKTLVGYGT